MCSFIFSTFDFSKTNFNNFMRHRGPDRTIISKIENYYFCHNLLSMRGDYVKQPYVSSDGRIAILFNGEIYNCPDSYDNEVQFIEDSYREHTGNFFRELDGEYAIILIDFKLRIGFASKDCFGTKPLYFGQNENHFAFASYASALQESGFESVTSLKPNQSVKFKLDMSSIKLRDIYKFDIAQTNNRIDGWYEKFDEAVAKRIKHLRGIPFIGLSSGYDSGAIAASLISQGRAFNSFTISGRENRLIIEERLRKINDSGNKAYEFEDTSIDREKWQKFIEKNAENAPYKILNGVGEIIENTKTVHSDKASTLLAFICSEAKKKGSGVYISGSGADEIYSDYGFDGVKHFPHSNFGGKFPKNLLGTFPWASFYRSTQEAYLAKEEFIAGAFGIETRYPFLDVKLVQEFLSLNSNIKNKVYKSVIDGYLEIHGFPVKKGKKIGFGFSKNEKQPWFKIL